MQKKMEVNSKRKEGIFTPSRSYANQLLDCYYIFSPRFRVLTSECPVVNCKKLTINVFVSISGKTI